MLLGIAPACIVLLLGIAPAGIVLLLGIAPACIVLLRGIVPACIVLLLTIAHCATLHCIVVYMDSSSSDFRWSANAQIEAAIATLGAASWGMLANYEVDEFIDDCCLDASDQVLLTDVHALVRRAAGIERGQLRTVGLANFPPPCGGLTTLPNFSSASLGSISSQPFMKSARLSLQQRIRGTAGSPKASASSSLVDVSIGVPSSFINLPSEATSVRRAQHLEYFWTAYVEIGAMGLHWNPQRMQSEEKMAKLRQVLEEDWNESQTLSTHVTTLMEFRCFCGDDGIDWRDADPITTKLFLRSYERKGPTVPRQRLASLQWIARYVGLQLDTSTLRVTKAGKVAMSHIERQADPIRILLWRAIDNMLFVDNIFVVAIAVSWSLLIASVVRPKHSLMSVVQVIASRFEGKNRWSTSPLLVGSPKNNYQR